MKKCRLTPGGHEKEPIGSSSNMFQRVQTLYFLVALALTTVTLFVNVGRYILPSGDNIPWGSTAWWPLLALLILVCILLVAAMALFRHRLLQVRAGIFSILLLVGWYVLYFWYGYFTHSVLDATENYVEDLVFAPQSAAALPAVAILFIIFAVRAVLHDEALIRSLDRLR